MIGKVLDAIDKSPTAMMVVDGMHESFGYLVFLGALLLLGSLALMKVGARYVARLIVRKFAAGDFSIAPEKETNYGVGD